jgi:hypothetical protein
MIQQNINKRQTRQKSKVMKTGFRLLLILLLSLMAIKAGANTTKAISDQDSTLIIINKSLVNNNSAHFNSNFLNGHIFVTLPDTTINIIIISRRIYSNNCGLKSQIRQKTTLLCNYMSLSGQDYKEINIKIDYYKNYLDSISI